VYLVHEPDTHLVLEVALSPEAVRQRIASEVAQVRSVIWSPAWGAQSPFVGVIGEREIQMRVRHGYSNGFTRLLSGTIGATEQGSRLELTFRSLLWVELLMRAVWLSFLVPLVIHFSSGDAFDWAVVGGFAAMLGVLVGIEATGRRLGRRDEEHMRRALPTMLS